MSTDLPPDAIDLGVHTKQEGKSLTRGEVGFDVDGVEVGRAYQLVAIPVPAPEPPSQAERMAEWWAKYLGFDSQSRTQRENLVADMQAMIDEFGLVGRDEVPTVTQVMKALGCRRDGEGYWVTPGFSCYASTVESALVALGAARPDQEPDT